MVKINDPRNISGDTPRIRGAFLTLARGDQMHVQAWPKGRGKGGSPGKRYTEMKFAAQGRMAASMEAMCTLTAYEMTKDTQQVPRDFLMWCIQGRAYELVNPDGTVWKVRADMTTNPQYVLDDVTDTVGSILIRTDIGWIGLDPGNNDYILKMVNGLPEWSAYAGPSAPGAIVTTLRRTTAGGAGVVNTQSCTFQEAPIDENEVWDPAQPKRLYIPTGIDRFRLSCEVRYTGNVNNSTFRLETRDQTGSSAFFGAIRDNRLPNVSDVNEKYLCAIGPWSNATGIDYVELWVSYASAYSAQFLANTSLTLEVI